MRRSGRRGRRSPAACGGKDGVDKANRCIYTPPVTQVDIAACRACHCLSARKAARALTRLYEEKLRPHGLRATQFSVLAALTLRGPTPIRELADLLGLERTTLTRCAAVMRRNGWVTVGRSHDAREHPLEVTQAGRRTLEAAFPAWKEAQDLVDRGWKGW